MIGVFKQKSPANIILLLILGLLIKMPLFLSPQAVQVSPQDGALYHFLHAGLPAGNALAGSVIAFILIYIQAMLLNYLVNEHRLTTKQTFLPAMTYILITSLLPEWNYLSAPLIGNFFLIWILVRLYRLYNVPAAQGGVFNIGLLLGITSFIHFSSALFIVCVLLGIMILRPFRIKELLLLVLGAATPYYFFGAYLFLTDKSLMGLFPQIRFTVPVIESTIWLAVSTTLLGVPFLVGGYFIQAQLRKMLIQVRKYWSVLLLYLLVAFLVPFINSTASLHNWVVLLPPFAAFHACAYLYPPKRWLPLLLFFSTLGYVLYLQYGTNVWH